MATQWSRQLDVSRTNGMEIEITNWAGRFALVNRMSLHLSFRYLISSHRSLDKIGRAAFSDDFDCLSGQPHTLAETLDGLTNHENNLSSFYIRAPFWIVPSILNIGKKGKMIKETQKALGDIASRLWRDAEVAGPSDDRTLMSLICKSILLSGLWKQLY
jgi:hypothetical protein